MSSDRRSPHHLQVLGPRGAGDGVWARAHIIDDRALKPGDEEVSPFLIHLHNEMRCVQTGLLSACPAALQPGGPQKGPDWQAALPPPHP